MMENIVSNFHFLRPEWLYALIPALLVFTILKSRETRGSNWETTIDPTLLPYLLDNSDARATRSPLSLLLVAWIIATIALAGPAWRKIPQPVHERQDALMIVLNLSRSMYATDVSPNRMTRAQRKLFDLLDKRDEGVTGLVVFAGSAHTVAPLTDDTNTIAAMVQALGPEIMPVAGSRLRPALDLALKGFHDAGVNQGRILVITDEVRDIAQALEVARDNRRAFPVSVMAVGTPEGAAIPLDPSDSEMGYLRDVGGVLVIPKVDLEALRSFAAVAGGRFSRMTLTDEDLDYLLDVGPLPTRDEYRAVERDFDIWFEEGPWLILLLLPLAALAFRRGWLWSLALLFTFHSQPADALSLSELSWQDLWKTRDQQAMEALAAGDPETAAQRFKDPAWKGTARYRAGHYEDAAEHFANIESGPGRYNYGNALAKLGQLEQAIAAYEQALALDPDNEDAAYNKALVEELLKQQQESQQQGDDQQQQSKQDQSDEGDDSEQGQERHQQQQEQQQADQQEQDALDQDEQVQGDEGEAQQPQMTGQDDDQLDDEERQALEQWLRRVPDDPGGLLRRKFEKQYEDRLRRGEVSLDD